MPQSIICGDCGEVFYNGKNLKSPEEVVDQLNGICPKCGKKLSFDAKKIEIRAIEGVKKRGR